MQKIDSLCELLINQQNKLSFDQIKSFILQIRKEILSNRHWPFQKSQIKQLQKIYSKYEFEDEIMSADNLLSKKLSQKDLLKNYKYYSKLVSKDRDSFNKFIHHQSHNKILFVWWCPLSLTAILLVHLFWVNVDVLDTNHKACLYAKKIIKNLNLQNKIKILNINWKDFNNYDKYSIVYLASFLCYHKKDFLEIAKKIKNTKKCIHIISRTVSWR